MTSAQKLIQTPKKNVLQHDHDILQIIQARLPIYVLLLSGNNCLLYSLWQQLSIVLVNRHFFLNQSQNKMKSELSADLLALHKIRRKVDATYT
jgi:hypothetical protein